MTQVFAGAKLPEEQNSAEVAQTQTGSSVTLISVMGTGAGGSGVGYFT